MGPVQTPGPVQNRTGSVKKKIGPVNFFANFRHCASVKILNSGLNPYPVKKNNLGQLIFLLISVTVQV